MRDQKVRNDMAYIVDRELPKYCNKCPFGVVKSSLPLSEGTHSYQCSIKLEKGDRLEVKIDYELDVPKPEDCPLVEV